LQYAERMLFCISVIVHLFFLVENLCWFHIFIANQKTHNKFCVLLWKQIQTFNGRMQSNQSLSLRKLHSKRRNCYIGHDEGHCDFDIWNCIVLVPHENLFSLEYGLLNYETKNTNHKLRTFTQRHLSNHFIL